MVILEYFDKLKTQEIIKNGHYVDTEELGVALEYSNRMNTQDITMVTM